ncbi:Roundabout 2 [Fasciola hepatica]|uniref:Roundabout 2 n=1 Tax=Fasciola hepatica TaxID=6192 RepID=A0A4E0RYU9_FASHE|nr:Roundabout 2 [Fasciola hepatica]
MRVVACWLCDMCCIKLLAFLLLWKYCSPVEDKADNKPVFTTSPEDTFLPYDQQLTLKCIATGYPTPTITWFKDQKVVQTHRDKPGTSNRITNHGELIILRFSASDEGVYYCNASNVHGWAKSASATVRSAFFDSNKALVSEDKVAHIGDTVVFECVSPTGLPRPVVSWTRDGVDLSNNHRVRIVDYSNLKIHPVKQSDAGSYRCKAENLAGRWESGPCKLTVQRKSRFTATPGDKQAVVGESVDFQCMATDAPNSTIVWRKSVGKMRAKLWNKRSLRIENVQLSDAGDYVCEVKNAHRRTEAVAHLSVILPPTFLVTPDDRTVSIGDSVTFDCVASGAPLPVVRWIHNGETYWVPSTHDPVFVEKRKFVFHNGTLVITSVIAADEGVYECRASQLAGIVKSLSRLLVETPFAQPLPLIELVPQNLTIYSGMIATFPCQATVFRSPRSSHTSTDHSFPEIISHWFINGMRVSPPNDRRIVLFNTGSLQLHAVRPSDSGVYTCEVEVQELSRGIILSTKTSWSAYLTVLPEELASESVDVNFEGKTDDNLIPHPPERVELLSVGDTWITILIDPPEKNKSTLIPEWPSEYHVEFAEYNSSSGWQVACSSVKTREARIENIKPQTGYYILVRGVNKFGVGRPRVLDQIVYTLASSTRDDADQMRVLARLQQVHFNLPRSRPLSPLEAFIEWTTCGDTVSLSEISAHKITVKPVPLSRCLSIDAKVNGYVLRYHEDRTSSSDPQCPSNDSSAEYEVPDEFSHCSLSELRGSYDLSADPPLSFTREHLELNTDEAHSTSLYKRAVIPELKPFICYSMDLEPVGIHPQFGHLFGPRSRSTTVLTYDSAPTGAPKVFRALWIQNGTVLELHWHPPALWEQGGVLTGYSMRLIGPSMLSNRNFNVGPDQQSYRLHGLDTWSNYTIYLAAVNCRGEGIRSLPVQVFAHSVINPSTSSVDLKTSSLHPNQGAHFRRVIYDGREAITGNLILASQSLPPVELVEMSPSEERGSLIREPWFIVSVVAFSLLWILVVLGLVLCGRHRSRRHRRRATVLDPVDVGTVTKNGRFGPASETYPLSLASTPLLPTSTPDINGLSGVNAISGHAVSANDPHFYGDQRKLGNGFVPPILSQQNGLLPVVSFPGSVVCNGSVQPAFTYYPHYSLGPQLTAHIDGMNSTSYITTNSIPINMQTTNIQGYQTNETHRSPHPLSVATARGGQLSNQPGPTTGRIGEEIAEDTVSPYASVPVLQQMAYDRNPTVASSVHPVDGVVQSIAPSGCRQLSLAEIIPPPPDYPPPSVPSCSPPLALSTTCRNGTGWPQGSGSGDDSAYYAHSDLQSAISHEPEESGGANLWLTQGSETNKTSGVPLDWSQHETSSSHTTSKPMLISSGEQTTGYLG